tara:strand:- start:693 stop:842 length:150 start_codon:yes stop_codon:yes gene_type:complete
VTWWCGAISMDDAASGELLWTARAKGQAEGNQQNAIELRGLRREQRTGT